eukprot:scaffold196668_cov31-Tisochrysis_lutea.AAC.1
MDSVARPWGWRGECCTNLAGLGCWGLSPTPGCRLSFPPCLAQGGCCAFCQTLLSVGCAHEGHPVSSRAAGAARPSP